MFRHFRGFATPAARLLPRYCCICFEWMFHARGRQVLEGRESYKFTEQADTVWCLFCACWLISHSWHSGILSETLFLCNVSPGKEVIGRGRAIALISFQPLKGTGAGVGGGCGGREREGEREGKKGRREKYGMVKPLSFPVTVKIPSKLK